MKQYAILSHPLHPSLIISTNSLEYPDYMLLGYNVVYQGNKKECESVFESDGALCD